MDSIEIDMYDQESVQTIQKFIRRVQGKKYLQRFREKVQRVIHDENTVRITPAKFKMPLYIVQKTCCNKIFGKITWKKYKIFLNNRFLHFFNILYILSYSFSIYSIFTQNYNVNWINFFPFLFVAGFYMVIQTQLLILIMSTLSCKFYLCNAIVSAIGLTDLFRDWRLLDVWLVCFPMWALIPLVDAIPKYLPHLRKMLNFFTGITIIYNLCLVFGISFGYIDIYNRELSTQSQINGKNITTFSNATFVVSCLNTMIIIMIKNLFWSIYQPHRAVLLKNPTLITSLREWKNPKEIHRRYNGTSKFCVEKKVHEEVTQLHVTAGYMFFNHF